MEPIIETGNDVVTVIAEPDAMTFCTRKEWEQLPEVRLNELSGYALRMAFKGTSSVYFLLHDFTALGFGKKLEDRYKLVKIAKDEDDKMVFYTMQLSAAECDQLKKNRLTLWD